MRAKLGLAPLRTTPKEEVKQEVKEPSPKKQKMEEMEGLEQRLHQAKRKRREEALKNTETLGVSGEDVDDVMAWVEKSREKTTAGVAVGGRKSKRKGRVEGVGLDEAKIVHSLEGLEEEEEMILTLADRGILDDKGELAEEEGIVLENVQTREQRDREKALRASQKAKPLWEEDGVRRTMLDKYDEEEEEAFVLGQSAAVPVHPSKAKEGLQEKLLAAQSALSGPPPATGGDYYTKEEERSLKKPKKKGKKKERRLKKKSLTSDDIDELEKLAEQNEGNLGSREQRLEKINKTSKEKEVEMASKRSKFEAALSKANLASEGLRKDDAGVELEEEDGLMASLAKARELAMKRNKNTSKDLDSLAHNIIERRKKAEAEAKNVKGGLTFTNIGEFARSVAVENDTKHHDEEITMPESIPVYEKDAQQEQAMEIDTNTEEADGESNQRRKGRYRRHVEDKEGMDYDEHNTEEKELLGQEKAIGLGLGSALSFLKERGELQQPVEWAGRTNDSKNSYFTKAMGGYKDVYTGGRTEDQLAADVEVALTRKDEFGRILTPKEAYRHLCYSFHGIQPSQNTKEKRIKQINKELSQKRAATTSANGGVVTGLKALQEKAATPYMVLSGTVKPGQTRDAG